MTTRVSPLSVSHSRECAVTLLIPFTLSSLTLCSVIETDVLVRLGAGAPTTRLGAAVGRVLCELGPHAFVVILGLAGLSLVALLASSRPEPARAVGLLRARLLLARLGGRTPRIPETLVFARRLRTAAPVARSTLALCCRALVIAPGAPPLLGQHSIDPCPARR